MEGGVARGCGRSKKRGRLWQAGGSREWWDESQAFAGVTRPVARASGDTAKSHVLQFVSGATGVAGATVAPATGCICC